MELQKWFKKESIGKSTTVLFIFNLGEKIILMVRGIIFARLLGPAEYGVFALAFFFIPIVVAISKLGIPSSFARYIPQYEMKNALKDFNKKTYRVVTLGGIGITLLCVLNAPQLSQLLYGSPMYSGLILICALTILPNALLESLAATFSGLRVFTLDALLRFGQFILFTSLGIILVMVYAKTGYILLANLISLVVVVLIFGLLAKKYFAGLKSQDLAIKERGFHKKIMKFSVFFILSSVVYLMFISTDRWILNRLMDLTNVGVYSVGSKISGLIFTFGMITGNVLIPNLSNIWEQGDKKKVDFMLNLSTKASILLLLTGAVILLLSKELLIPLLYGAEYAGSIPIIGCLLVFWLMQSINWTLGGYASLVEKTYITLICNVLGLTCNIILNFIFIPKFGLMGAAVASAFSSTLILITLLLWFSKEGFKLSPQTGFVCLTPFILVFPKLIVILLFIGIIGLALKTNFILSHEERDILYSKIKRGWLQVNGKRP